MEKIEGKQNEKEFVRYINNKKICELNILFIELLEKLFGKIDYNSVVYSWLNDKPQKTDFFIRIGSSIKRISLKIGDKNSIHCEPISEFVHFLISNNIDRETIIKFLKCHYSDGSTNGSGEVRMSIKEYKEKYQTEIDDINSSLNNVDFIGKVLDRFIFKGRNDYNSIDALVYGSVCDFFFLTKEDITSIILSKKDDYSTGIHIGPLFVQPQSRNLLRNPRYEKCRYCVQIKWFNLLDHIVEYKNKNLSKVDYQADNVDSMSKKKET